MRTLILGSLLALLLVAPAPAQVRARGRLNAGGGATHGGKLHRTEAHRFEVVFDEARIRIYAYDAEGEPTSIRGVSGRATFLSVRATTGASRRGVGHQSSGAKLAYLGASPKRGRLRDCLVAEHSLGQDQRQGLRVDVTLRGVDGEPNGAVEFRVEFATGTTTTEWACDASGCSQTIFLDPGECPACHRALRRKAWAERRRLRASGR